MNEAYLWEFLNTQDDITIVDSFVKANSVINNPLYETILCSISGGSDSDVVLDLISRVDLNEKADNYRPIFWYKDNTKENYEIKFNIKHSACYTKYGFKRTGCCRCPYGRDIDKELEVTRIYEPNLYKAVCNVFKDSYEYTRKYREFVQVMKLKEDKKQLAGQMDISEFITI